MVANPQQPGSETGLLALPSSQSPASGKLEGRGVEAMHTGLFPGSQSRVGSSERASEGAKTCSTASGLAGCKTGLGIRPTTFHGPREHRLPGAMWQPCLAVASLSRRHGMHP